MINEELESAVRQNFPDAVEGSADCKGRLLLTVRADQIVPVCRFAKEKLGFDFPDCITGIDTGQHLEVVYTLWSVDRQVELNLKVVVPYDNPVLDSVTCVWQGANWHEREIYDLFGIEFKNHPDLRRILLPEDFEGFPFRKDYTEID
ncbi:MAG: NADH-quinone oxidoreductase subunit C [Armatimonadota bacterium]